MENHENLIGKVLGGRYTVESIVGEGGMSVVMKAHDAEKDTDVTIKLLNLKDSEDQHAVERFTNEATAVERLSHPNIVTVFDVSLDGEDKYMVMEYINGITLKEYLDKKGRLGWREAVHYTNQVLAALSHAHEKGIIHRDIKPENVMLMRNGSIKVIDFGIAKLPDSKSLTVIDKAIGTVNYISPEQASGSISTEKSDVYSTGIMLYELVTGQLPFVSASSVSVAMMHVSSEPAMPSSICDSIPTGLEQIIIKAMMKDPEKRFGSANAMRKAIEYLTLHPEAVFREKNSVDADGKPILSTGASSNNGNNTVITDEISPNDIDDADNNDEYSDSVNEEDEYSEVKPRNPSMLPIVMGITFAFFAVILVFVILLFNKAKELDEDSALGSIFHLFSTEEHRDKNDSITVPNLLNKAYTQEIYNNLTNQGFNVTVNEVYNDKVVAGLIISQTPLGGSTKKINENGIDITLEVSRGSSEIILRDYKHYRATNVKLALESYGIKVVIEKEFHDTVISDHIIRTSPEKGAVLLEGDTVTLYASNGPADMLVRIPEEVIGLTYIRAEHLLQENGLIVDSERGYEYSDKYEEDTVIATVPAVGKNVSVSKGKVKLILSKGSEPKEEAVETGTVVTDTPAVNPEAQAPTNTPDTEAEVTPEITPEITPEPTSPTPPEVSDAPTDPTNPEQAPEPEPSAPVEATPTAPVVETPPAPADTNIATEVEG